MRTRLKWWLCLVLAFIVVGVCAFWFFGSRTDSRLLGKWVYVSGYMGLDPTDTDAIGERGIEFLKRSRFVTFGYKSNGRVVDSYGTYSFVSSNRIEMSTTGFRTIFDGTNADVKLDGKLPPELNRPRYLIFSPEQQELSEADYITMPARFTRTGT